MSTDEQLKNIKLLLRAHMNGPVSQSLRDRGLNYRVIFGVEWPRIVELAGQYPKSHALAAALWKENIRECRLMAPLLQPIDSYDGELAEVWIEDMYYPEEAQYCTMCLFQHLPNASDLAFKWIASSTEMKQLCGWLLITRLFMRLNPLNQQSENEFIDQADCGLNSNNIHIRQAVRNAIFKYALIGKREKLRINNLLVKCQF